VTRTERLVARIEGDVSDLKRSLREGEGALSGFESKVGKTTGSVLGSFSKWRQGGLAIAAALTAITASVVKVVNSVDGMAKTARAAGLSAEAFQEYSHAADLAGIESEAMSGALIKLNVNLGKATAGSKKQVDALNALGVTSTDTNTALGQIADGMQRIQDPAERARLAAVLFGQEAGPRLVELLSQGSGAMEQLRATTEKLTNAQVAYAEKLNDEFDQLTNTVGTQFKQAVLDAAKATDDWMVSLGVKAPQGAEQLRDKIAQTREEIVKTNQAMTDWNQHNNPAWQKRLANQYAQLHALESELAGPGEAPKGIGPDGKPRTGGSGNKPGSTFVATTGGKTPAEKQAESELKAQEAINARIYDAYVRQRDREYQLQVESGQRIYEQLEYVADARALETEAIEAQKETMLDFTRSVGSSISEMAVRGTSATDQLKRKLIEALLVATSQSFGAAAGGSSKGGWAGFGLNLLGAFGGVAASSFSAPSTVNPATGGTFTPQGPGFASGGSGVVRGPGIGDRPVTAMMAPGEIVNVSRPGGTGGGGMGKVEQNVDVSISVEPGMTATQERRRLDDGREQIRIAVRAAIRDEVSRGGPAAGALIADQGGRRAPRGGIS
jgi:hypothetical protein